MLGSRRDGTSGRERPGSGGTLDPTHRSNTSMDGTLDTLNTTRCLARLCIVWLSVSLLHRVRPRRRAQRVIAGFGFADSLFKPWCLRASARGGQPDDLPVESCPWNLLAAVLQLLCGATNRARQAMERQKAEGGADGRVFSCRHGHQAKISGSFPSSVSIGRPDRRLVTAKLASPKDPFDAPLGSLDYCPVRVVASGESKDAKRVGGAQMPQTFPGQSQVFRHTHLAPRQPHMSLIAWSKSSPGRRRRC